MLRFLCNAVKETAIGTASALASTAIAIGTYKGVSSSYTFFQEQCEKSSQNSLMPENPVNNVAPDNSPL